MPAPRRFIRSISVSRTEYGLTTSSIGGVPGHAGIDPIDNTNVCMNSKGMTGIPKSPGGAKRGAETRERLVDAALELFGTRGFHGASVRDIAEAADANIAAVGYHFGGKDGLYLAVARSVGDTFGAAFLGLAEDAGARLAAGGRDRESALTLLSDLMQRFVRHVIRTRRNRAVVGFVIGEQLRPTEAFPILFESGMRQFLDCLAEIVAVVEDCEADDERAAFLVMTLFGQAISFGVGQTMLLRRLGRSELADDAVDRIAVIVGETAVGSLLHPSAHSDIERTLNG